MMRVSSWCWWIDSCKVSLKASHPWSLVTASGAVICARTPGLGCAEGWALLWSPGAVVSVLTLVWRWSHTRTNCPCHILWAGGQQGGTSEANCWTSWKLSAHFRRSQVRKICKNTGEKLPCSGGRRPVWVWESRAEGLPLPLISMVMAQHCSHTVVNCLGNLSSENAKSEKLKRMLEEPYSCRAIWSTALRSWLWDWSIGDSRELNVLQKIYSFQISFFMDNCITSPLQFPALAIKQPALFILTSAAAEHIAVVGVLPWWIVSFSLIPLGMYRGGVNLCSKTFKICTHKGNSCCSCSVNNDSCEICECWAP